VNHLELQKVIHVQSKIINSKGNTNTIWKIINRCLLKQSKTSPNINGNPADLANKFNTYCVVPENINTPTPEGIGHSRGVGVGS